MSDPIIIRPRRPLRRSRGRTLVLTPDRLAAAGMQLDAPKPGFVETDPDRDVIVSGLVSGAIHAAALVALIVIGWGAPEVLEETLIPVKLLRELPGSNEAPAPKALAARQPLAANGLSPAQAATVSGLPAPRISPAALRMARIEAAAPQRIERRQLEANPLDVQKSVREFDRSALDVATLHAVPLAPSDLKAPVMQFEGPRAVESLAPTNVTAPQIFAPLEGLSDWEYSDQADARAGPARGLDAAATFSAVRVETEVSGAFLGASGGGGGTAGPGSGVVPCMESAYVHRYLQQVKERTHARWEVPEGTASDQVVKLRFALATSGSAIQIEFLNGPEALAPSAIEALRSAAPFPPMGDNVRCLSELRLTASFSANPTR